jgi:hypothetical protein
MAFGTADGPGHVTGLQVGERGPVGDDVLKRAHVGVVDRRLVDVRQHPPATVYQTFDPGPAAVPTQSFLARSKYDGAPGAPGATGGAGRPSRT